MRIFITLEGPPVDDGDNSGDGGNNPGGGGNNPGGGGNNPGGGGNTGGNPGDGGPEPSLVLAPNPLDFGVVYMGNVAQVLPLAVRGSDLTANNNDQRCWLWFQRKCYADFRRRRDDWRGRRP